MTGINVTYHSQTMDDRRTRYLNRANWARERAARSPVDVQKFLLHVAGSWELLADSAGELDQLKRKSPFIIAERLRECLHEDAGHSCCDECLADRIGVNFPNVAVATWRIGTAEAYNKYLGRCDYCGNSRLVTSASPGAV